MTAEQLKSIRATLGLTQAQLAHRLGVVPSTVAKWEQGVHPISPMAERAIRSLN